jgi:RNA polymerase sigma-70 factor (ECF subfamily)
LAQSSVFTSGTTYRRGTLQVALKEDGVIAIPGEIERAFQSHHGMVFRTAYRITGNAADAEDVLQTVFMRLVRRSGPAQPFINTESYLRRAAINASIDLIRSRQQDRKTQLFEMPSRAPQQDSSELREVLRQALARLSGRSAEIFSLRFFEDFSNQEIARILRISLVTVAVTVHRARQQLRKELRLYLGEGNE